MAPVKFSFDAIGSSAVVFSLFERSPDAWRRAQLDCVRRPLRCPTACASLWHVLHAAHIKPTPSPFITIGSLKADTSRPGSSRKPFRKNFARASGHCAEL